MKEKMPPSRAGFATVNDRERPATAEADARSLYADVMHGIGSVSRLRVWRKLAKGVLTRMGLGGELAWLRAPCAAAAAGCMSCFPRALSLRIVGDTRAGEIGGLVAELRVPSDLSPFSNGRTVPSDQVSIWCFRITFRKFEGRGIESSRLGPTSGPGEGRVLT